MKLICLNSGEGSRMRPLSYNTHKSMIPLNGDPIVVRSLKLLTDAVSESPYLDDIDEIVFVTTPEFWDKYSDQILSKFSVLITPVFNLKSKVYNNWYSMRCALEYLNSTENGLVPFVSIEGDLYLNDSIKKTFTDQCLSQGNFYFCKYSQNEWVFCKTPHGKTRVVKGANGLAMSGITVINKGIDRLFDHLNSKYCRVSDYWDDILLSCLGDEITPVKVHESVIKEFDSVKDLLESRMIYAEEIAQLTSDDGIAEPLDSMTNSNFLITFQGQKKVLRLPGYGTENFIERSREKLIYDDLGFQVTPNTILFEESPGVKLTDYIDNGRVSSDEDVGIVLSLLGNLHKKTPLLTKSTLTDLVEEVEMYRQVVASSPLLEDDLVDKFVEISEFYIDKIVELQNQEVVLCHRDLDPRNILITKDKSYLLDFEYSGVLNRYWDLGAHLAELRLFFNYTPDHRYEEAIQMYDEITGFKTNMDDILLWSGIVDFVWSYWTLAKISLGEDYNDYLKERWTNACAIYDKFYKSTI